MMMVLAPVIALFCTGLAAGVFLGHRAGVSRAAPVLSASSFIQLQQTIHKTFARMMPVLVIGSVLASALWAVLLRACWRSGEFWLVSVAALAMVWVATMTRAVNIPINNRLVTWNPAAPPADWSAMWSRWEQIHSIRTVLAIVAFAAEVIALRISTPCS